MLRSELEGALRAVDEAAATGAGEDPAADEALELVRELDALERIPARIDTWLRVAMGCG